MPFAPTSLCHMQKFRVALLEMFMPWVGYLHDFSFHSATLTRSVQLTIRLLGLAKRVSSAGKYLVKVILEPSDIWAQASEFPDTVNLLVPVRVCAVSVALDRNLRAGLVGVLLVGYTELVVASNLRVGNLLPLRAADKVLRLEQWVAENVWVRGHGKELFRRHCFPKLVEEGKVVDSQSRRDAGLQSGPVLCKFSQHLRQQP